MSQHIRNLCSPPASFEELKSAIACRHVTFPLRVENVAKRVLAKPELMAFGSATSIADDCGVSVSLRISVSMKSRRHAQFSEMSCAAAWLCCYPSRVRKTRAMGRWPSPQSAIWASILRTS